MTSLPDGLERVARDKNFIQQASNLIKAPFSDYLIPGISNEKLSAILTGIIGATVVFILGISLGKLLRKKR